MAVLGVATGEELHAGRVTGLAVGEESQDERSTIRTILSGRMEVIWSFHCGRI